MPVELETIQFNDMQYIACGEAMLSMGGSVRGGDADVSPVRTGTPLPTGVSRQDEEFHYHSIELTQSVVLILSRPAPLTCTRRRYTVFAPRGRVACGVPRPAGPIRPPQSWESRSHSV